MVARTVVVRNALGVHARAAAKFVHAASAFAARITVTRGDRAVDGKSILGILLLAAARGFEITVAAEGSDENAALAALVGLVESGFGEGPCAD
ncbi:MAG: HPr family phosphocarrier protein [Acidobacteria bacterium]|nr:HPr family phosphocarrier protein [Acidobacteriota bacterium]